MRNRVPAGDRSNPFPAILPATAIVVAVTNASVQSAAMAAGVSLVRVVSTVVAHIKIGANPTAATTDTYLPAGVPEYFMVDEGDKIAVIRSSGDGSLFITPATLHS